MTLSDRIVATADTCSGHPRIDGTRMRVSNVLGLLAAGMSAEEIVEEYPYVTLDDIRACLNYAAEAIDAAPVPAE